MNDLKTIFDVSRYLKKELPKSYEIKFSGDKLEIFPFHHFETYTLRLLGRLLFDNKDLHIRISYCVYLHALIWFYDDAV